MHGNINFGKEKEVKETDINHYENIMKFNSNITFKYQATYPIDNGLSEERLI